MQDIAKLVSSMESELETLRTRSISDGKTIELLKRQNADQAVDIARMTQDHAIEVRTLKQERDVAVRRSVEVSGILDEAATSVINGLRKMREGSIAPSSHGDDPLGASGGGGAVLGGGSSSTRRLSAGFPS